MWMAIVVAAVVVVVLMLVGLWVGGWMDWGAVGCRVWGVG